MQKRVNIPLANSTRHETWRVLWKALTFIGFFFFVLLVMHALSFSSTSATLQPLHADSTVFLRWQPQSETILKTALHTPLFEDIPLQTKDFLAFSKKEVSLHLTSEGKIIGITVDTLLPEEQETLLKSFGLHLFTFSHYTLITTEEEPVTAEKQTFFPISHPFRNGFIFQNTTGTLIPLSLEEKWLELPNYFAIPKTPVQHITQSTEVDSYFPFPTEDLIPLLSNLAGEPLSVEIEEAFGALLLGEDEQGDVFSIFIPVTHVSNEALGRISYEFSSRKTLFTSLLTLNDNSAVREIRSNPHKIQSEISQTDTLTRIVSSTSDGDTLFVHKTDQGIHLANRDFFSHVSSITPADNSCLQTADFFLSTNQLQNLFIEDLFSRISFSSKTIRFCF